MSEREHAPVPGRPEFILRVRTEPSGGQSAWLDDEPVTVPPGTGIHRALIQAARRRADRTGRTGTIRVAGLTPDGAVFHLAVAPDGSAWEVGPPEPEPVRAAPDSGSAETAANAPGPSEPGAVPADVSHVAELREQDGRPVGSIDGEGFALQPGQDPYAQLLREVRHRADAHSPGRPVRVIGRGPDGRAWHVALAADGSQRILGPAPSASAPSASASTAPTPAGPAAERPHTPPAPATDEPAPRPDPAGPRPAPVNAFRPAPAAPRTAPPDADDERSEAARTEDAPGVRPGAAPASPAAPVPTSTPAPASPSSVRSPAPEADHTRPLGAPAGGDADDLTDDLGRPIPTSTTSAGDLTQFAPSPASHPRGGSYSVAPTGSDERRTHGPSRRNLLLGGAGAIVLAGAATAGYLALRGRDEPSTPASPSPTGTPLPEGIQAPAGLPGSYVWSVNHLADASPRLVVTGQQMICAVNNDATGGVQLVSFDTTSGKPQWKSDLPVDAVVENGPVLVPIDGRKSIVVTTTTQILAFGLSGGDPRTWPVESEWSTSVTPSGVIVTKSDDKHGVFILRDDRLVRRATSTHSTAVAVLDDGTVVSTDLQGQVWRSAHKSKEPKPVHLKAPAGTTPGTFVGATASQLITAFVPRERSSASRLRSFALPDLEPRVTTAPIDPAVFPDTFLMAPDETWAVGRNAWIDLTTGDSHVIAARWSPLSISQYNTWSKVGDNVLTANNRGKSLAPAEDPQGQISVPKGGTERLAFCAASVGSDTTLYAVPTTASRGSAG